MIVRGNRVFRLLVGASLLSIAAPCLPSETINYTYDARGRLVQVARSGTINNGVAANYTYDPADNRTNVTVSTGGASPPSFSVGDVSATEGGNLVFTVTKTGTASSSFSVNYATANGTATAGSDYTAASGTLTFTSTDTAKAVTVITTDDAAVESAETVLVNLSGETGGATISDAQGVGTINDNDVSNQPPVANADSAGSIPMCGTTSKNVVANDTDPEGNYPLSLVSASPGGGIFVTVESSTTIGIESYGPTGSKTFTYVVQDSLGATATGSGTVTVTTSGTCEGPELE